MRALSLRQASRCETAKHPQCKCRCHGALHGVKRNEVREYVLTAIEGDRLFFEALPEDDPHHVRSDEEKKRRRRKPRSPVDPVSTVLVGVQQRLWPEEN